MIKENKAMKIVAFLLVATLITSSLVSDVVARYSSGAGNSNAASVAQWGVVISASGSLFNRKDASGNNVVDVGERSSGSGLTLSINGVSETAGELSYYINQQNVFLGEGTWGIMVKTEYKAPTIEIKTQSGVMPSDQGQGDAEQENTSEGTEEEAVLDGVGVSVFASESEDTTTYYTFADGVYSKVEHSALVDGGIYYVLSNEVTAGTSYWPLVFQLTGAGSVGYIANEAAATSINTLAGVAETLRAVFESQARFNADVNLTDWFGLNHQNITWSWTNCQYGCNKNEITITGGDNISLCATCMYDTILQMLKGEESGTMFVVKKAAEHVYRTPVAATADSNYTNNDYNLKVNFDLKIVVNQAD